MPKHLPKLLFLSISNAPRPQAEICDVAPQRRCDATGTQHAHIAGEGARATSTFHGSSLRRGRADTPPTTAVSLADSESRAGAPPVATSAGAGAGPRLFSAWN